MVRSLGILPLFTLKFKQSTTPLNPSRQKIMTQACLSLALFVRMRLVFHSLFLPLNGVSYHRQNHATETIICNIAVRIFLFPS